MSGGNPATPRRIGSRVRLRGSHTRAGESGRIVGSPGRVFNGWLVRLDRGLHVGASKDQMGRELR